MGRKENDVFVLGDETLIAEPDSTQDADLVGDNTTRDYSEFAESHEYVAPKARNRVAPAPRRLAVLGLGAGAATVVAVSMLSAGGGNQPTPPPRSTSLVSSPPSLPAMTQKVAAPSPRPQPHANHRTRRAANAKRDVRKQHSEKSERETTEIKNHATQAQDPVIEAPVDSAVSIPVTVPPTPPSVPVTVPDPPSPPPSPQGGGGSGQRAEFNFER